MHGAKPVILVTNDDGIHCFFLKKLVEVLSGVFEVYVAAPLREQSWIGRAVSRYRTVHCKEVGGLICKKAWALDGTPTDCVNIALGHLMPERPVAVVSGINVSENVSTPIIYSSGTVGGAMEGACWGIHAFALSHRVTWELYSVLKEGGGNNEVNFEGEMARSLEYAARHAAGYISRVIGGGEARRFVVHNINYPYLTGEGTEEERTVLSKLFLGGLFEERGEGAYEFVHRKVEELEVGPGTDRYAVRNGRISISEIDVSEVYHREMDEEKV